MPKITDIVAHDEDDSLQTIDASNNEMEKAYSKYFTSGNAVSHSSLKGRHDSLQSQSVAKEIDTNKRLILRYKAGRKLRDAIQNDSQIQIKSSRSEQHLNDKIEANKDVSKIYANKLDSKYLRNKLGPLRFEENTL